MRITVTSDDGKEATIPYPSDLSVEDLAERICLGLSAYVANDLLESITVTERPAETPADDGFKFKVGQRVLTLSGRYAKIMTRFKNERGQHRYYLNWEQSGEASGCTWTDAELHPAEEPC